MRIGSCRERSCAAAAGTAASVGGSGGDWCGRRVGLRSGIHGVRSRRESGIAICGGCHKDVTHCLVLPFLYVGKQTCLQDGESDLAALQLGRDLPIDFGCLFLACLQRKGRRVVARNSVGGSLLLRTLGGGRWLESKRWAFWMLLLMLLLRCLLLLLLL